MTADTAIAVSYLLGLVAIALDAWRARAQALEARERLLEESDAR